MNIKDNFLIYKIFNTICTNNNIENLDEDLKLVFSDYYDISEINILYFDKQINKLKIVVKDFELAEDYYSEEKLKNLNNIYEKLLTSNYVLNDDISLPEDVFDTEKFLNRLLEV